MSTSYSIPKVGLSRRIISIPNPYHQILLSDIIVTNWSEITDLISSSEISCSKPIEDDKGDRSMRTEFTFGEFQEFCLINSFDKRYELVTDISKYYPTIYTHSIPWAIHSKKVAKENRNNFKVNNSTESTRVQSDSEKKLTGGLDAFSLFCAYHLGIGPNKEYKPTNINEIARRFGQDQGVVKQALKDCKMDSASLLDKDFDMALAQLDIQVAPEGIDKIELAKSIYEDFLEAPSVKRDWKKIIEEDRKENRKIFG